MSFASSEANEQAMPLITIDKLSRCFTNGYKGLDSLSVALYEHEFVVLAGKNGSGKTLLMKHVAALEQADSGAVFYKGQSVFTRKGSISGKIGLIFQDAETQILGDTVYEDICIGPKNLKLNKTEIAERAEAALHWAELGSRRQNHPATLSGGEKRRLAIAGMLAMNCETLIFDEPFANLDYPSIIHVLESLVKLHSEGKTVLVLTHELEKVLAHADRLLVLDAGRLVVDVRSEQFYTVDYKQYGLRPPFTGKSSLEELTWLP